MGGGGLNQLPCQVGCGRCRAEDEDLDHGTILMAMTIKEIGVLRDTARAPQPPTDPPTGH